MFSSPAKLSLLALLFAAGCAPANTSLDGDSPRGPLGKTDAAGTCEGACDGQAQDGNCWCDGQCQDFGDCCSDRAEVCEATQPSEPQMLFLNSLDEALTGIAGSPSIRAFAGDEEGRLHTLWSTGQDDPRVLYLRARPNGDIDPGAAFFDGEVDAIEMCSFGPNMVYAVLADDLQLHVFRSRNAGDNWTQVTSVTPQIDREATELKVLCSTNGELAVLTRHLGRDDIRVFASTDEGETFSESELDFNAEREDLPYGDPQICTDGHSGIYVGFVDYLNSIGQGSASVYASSDFGQHFGPPVRVNTSDWTDFFLACGDDDQVYFADRYRFMSSQDGGTSWTANQIPVASSQSAHVRSLQGVGDALYLVVKPWHDEKWIYASVDGGETWGPKQIVAEQGYGGLHASALGDSGVATLAWEDENDIWFSQSSDGGVTWPLTPTSLSAGDLFGVQAAGDYVFFLWRDVIEASGLKVAIQHH